MGNFCELSHCVDFNDVTLKDIFRFGIDEPLHSSLPGGKNCWSLERYIDFVLSQAGSPFTVGVADGQPRNCAVTAPEHLHIPTFMSGVAISKPAHIMSATPRPANIMPAMPKPANVMPAAPGPAQIMPVKSKFIPVMSTCQASVYSCHTFQARVYSCHTCQARVCSCHACQARVCSCHACQARVCSHHAGHARACSSHAGHARVCSHHADHARVPGQDGHHACECRALARTDYKCVGPTTDVGAKSWHPQGHSIGCHRDCSPDLSASCDGSHGFVRHTSLRGGACDVVTCCW